MDPASAHGLWTALLMVLFVGIVAWAWSSRRRGTFEEAARMPLEDDAPRKGAAEERADD